MPLLDLLNRRFGKNSFTDYSRDDNQDNDETVEISFKNSLPIDSLSQDKCIDERMVTFLKELSYDIALERSAQIQYIIHANEIEGKDILIAEDLLIHADDEYNHQKILSDRLNYLKSKITTEVGEIKTSDDAEEMLRQDLSGETTAIERYKIRIQQAKELGDEGTAHILMQILTDEEHHENDLKTYLGV